MVFKTFRMFRWSRLHKAAITEEEIAEIVKRYITPNLFGNMTPKQSKQLVQLISCIAEINQTNTIKLLQEYHEWQQE